MQVKDLIKLLKQLPKDCQELDVRVLYNCKEDELGDNYHTNFWVDGIEVHTTGASGYELNGEVILIGSE